MGAAGWLARLPGWLLANGGWFAEVAAWLDVWWAGCLAAEAAAERRERGGHRGQVLLSCLPVLSLAVLTQQYLPLAILAQADQFESRVATRRRLF